MTPKKKLIEVALPLDAINKESLPSPQAEGAKGLADLLSQVVGSATNRSGEGRDIRADGR